MSLPVALHKLTRPSTTFLGDVTTLGRVICFGVDRSGPWWIGSFMENPALIGSCLFDVRVIMASMCALMVELLCQAVMRWVLVLKCILLGVHGC
jgi:hypothetical protein